MLGKTGFIRAILTVLMIGGLAGQVIMPAQAAGASTPASVGGAPDTSGGRPGYTMWAPAAGAAGPQGAARSAASPVNAAYTHTPPPTPGNDLAAGNGQIMPSQTISLVFWLPTGLHYEADAAGDTRYENLLQQWVNDVGGTSYHNLITQYNGTNGFIGQTVGLGAVWTDTQAYPRAGDTTTPLTNGDITTEVAHAVAVNGWTEDINHIVAVFTANGIQQCNNLGSDGGCTFKQPSHTGGYCAFHDHFNDGGNDAMYAFMSFDNGFHGAGTTCNAGDTSGDTDPNRGVYPSGDKSADVEVNTLSHEIIEAATDPHPNDTWTSGVVGEIGDACNFNFAPRNSRGADVYLNGHGYILQQEYSNLVHTCASDRCGMGICAPSVEFQKAVDTPAPVIGQTITYTVTLKNTHDSAAATNLDLTDTVPSGYTVTGLSAPNSTSSTMSPIDVKYDTLPVHQSQTVTITATVPAPPGAVATNCAGLALQNLLGAALSPLTTSPCATTTPQKDFTTTTVAGSPPASVFGQPVTFSATVSVNAPGVGTPSGTVDFFDGATNIGTGTLNLSSPDVAVIAPISSFTVGTHPITARYNGDTNDNPSTSSPALGYLVSKAPTSTAVTTSGSPSDFGSSVTFTAHVTPAPPSTSPPALPTGTVSFSVDAAPIASKPLDQPTGLASFATTSLLPGTHTIEADYLGDGNFLGSSGTVLQTVTCVHNITGNVPGAVLVGPGSTCIINATVGGAVLANTAGSALFIAKSTIAGAVASTGASILGICSSQIGGGISVRNATGFVVVGDPGDDGCAANTVLGGSVQFADNHGDVELVGNHLPSLVVTGTSGNGPLPDDTAAEIESNTISGGVSCSGNAPAPTNDGHPNTVSGGRIGQCSAI